MEWVIIEAYQRREGHHHKWTRWTRKPSGELDSFWALFGEIELMASRVYRARRQKKKRLDYNQTDRKWGWTQSTQAYSIANSERTARFACVERERIPRRRLCLAQTLLLLFHLIISGKQFSLPLISSPPARSVRWGVRRVRKSPSRFIASC